MAEKHDRNFSVRGAGIGVTLTIGAALQCTVRSFEWFNKTPSPEQEQLYTNATAALFVLAFILIASVAFKPNNRGGRHGGPFSSA